MTDNEIIKALEYKSKVGCELCDLKPDIYCQTCNIGLLKQSLDLIKRQQAEIAELQRKNTELEIELKAMRGAENSYKAEVERLQEVKEINLNAIKNDLPWFVLHLKSEAIKEFAERLKATDTADLVGEQYINGEIYGYFYSDAFERKIDNLVKEMTEVSNG